MDTSYLCEDSRVEGGTSTSLNSYIEIALHFYVSFSKFIQLQYNFVHALGSRHGLIKVSRRILTSTSLVFCQAMADHEEIDVWKSSNQLSYVSGNLKSAIELGGLNLGLWGHNMDWYFMFSNGTTNMRGRGNSIISYGNADMRSERGNS